MKVNGLNGWQALLVVAIISICGVVGYHFLVPPVAKPGSVTVDYQTIVAVSNQAKRNANNLREGTSKFTWDLNAERLGTRTLGVLTDIADTNKLKLSGFRIEKSAEVAGLQEATYVAVLEGPFPSISNALRTLEDPASKLSVNLFQVTSSDPDSDKVTATISLIGFVPPKLSSVAVVAGSPKS